jgi:glycine/D-amino acid oxidase-like deaminating enzyme
MIGDSKEDAGLDSLTQTPEIMRGMARRAVLSFPWIAELNIVRAWSALRVMAPDGLPIYDESARFPGAFTANCHSGVTLAGAHARLLAPMIARGGLDADRLGLFTAGRFDVPAAA